MAVSIASPELTMEYPAIFRSYIGKSVEHILTRVQRSGDVLASDDREQALHTLNFALKLAETWPDTRALLIAMAPKMEQAGYRDEWLPYLEQGIAQSRHLGDAETEAELRFRLGVLHRLRGRYEAAQTQFETSANLFEAVNAPAKQSQVLYRLAQIARLKREFAEAAQRVEAAFSLVDDSSGERAYGYLVLGTVALDQRAWPQAVDYFQRALNLWERDNEKRMMGRSLISLGAALRPMKKYNQAIAAYQQAIALFEAIHDPIYRAIVQMNLGNVYLSLEQPREALGYYQPAEQIFRQTQDRYYLAHVYHNIGMAYRQLEQWSKAEEAYLLSVNQQRQIGNVAWLVNALDGLGLTYLSQNQAKKAMETFEEALTELTKIEGEAGYEHLQRMLTAHMREALQPRDPHHQP